MEGSSQTFGSFSETLKGQQELPGSNIHGVPVEILSIIFILVKEAIFAPKFKGDGVVPVPTYKQPSQSPPLLVGAVCKRWRHITLAMAHLWTDIIINPLKPADGQVAMVNEWARRSSPHPLDISIFLRIPHEDPHHDEKIIIAKFILGVSSVLRSLAVRWNDVALDVPQYFRYVLLNNLKETPPISFFLPDVHEGKIPIKSQHPFRPRRLISYNISGSEIPCEWDLLVFLALEMADYSNILNIIRHAPNLTHCIAGEVDAYDDLRFFPIANTPIANHSLIYLHTNCHIIGHLTLPSLLHLNYVAANDIDERFDSLSKFLDRSSPPLDNFILRCYVDHLTDPIPRFEMLPGITSLVLSAGFLGRQDVDTTDNFINAFTRSFAHPILPHLKAFSLRIACLSGSSSLLFSHLFPDHKQNNLADIEGMPSTANDFRRPLSQVRVQLTLNVPVVMDKETFLHLSEVRKSGMDLSILDHHSKDVLRDMARVHGVESSYND